MSRYFVVGLNHTTKGQTNALQEWIKTNDLNWWHWVDGMWLLISNRQDLEVSNIRDQLNAVAPGVTSLVLEVEPLTWSGFGPKTELRDMFKWLRANWKR